jgi:hypothetical protein
MDITDEDAVLSQFFNFDELCTEFVDSQPDFDVPRGLEGSLPLRQLQHRSNLLEVDAETPLDEFHAFDCDPATHSIVPASFTIPPRSQQQEQYLAHSIHAVHDPQLLDGLPLHHTSQLGLPVDQSLPELSLVVSNTVRVFVLALHPANVSVNQRALQVTITNGKLQRTTVAPSIGRDDRSIQLLSPIWFPSVFERPWSVDAMVDAIKYTPDSRFRFETSAPQTQQASHPYTPRRVPMLHS